MILGSVTYLLQIRSICSDRPSILFPLIIPIDHLQYWQTDNCSLERTCMSWSCKHSKKPGIVFVFANELFIDKMAALYVGTTRIKDNWGKLTYDSGWLVGQVYHAFGAIWYQNEGLGVNLWTCHVKRECEKGWTFALKYHKIKMSWAHIRII